MNWIQEAVSTIVALVAPKCGPTFSIHTTLRGIGFSRPRLWVLRKCIERAFGVEFRPGTEFHADLTVANLAAIVDELMEE